MLAYTHSAVSNVLMPLCVQQDQLASSSLAAPTGSTCLPSQLHNILDWVRLCTILLDRSAVGEPPADCSAGRQRQTKRGATALRIGESEPPRTREGRDLEAGRCRGSTRSGRVTEEARRRWNEPPRFLKITAREEEGDVSSLFAQGAQPEASVELTVLGIKGSGGGHGCGIEQVEIRGESR